MSINVIGEAPPINIDALPGAEILAFAPATHQIVGVEKRDTNVQVDVGRVVETGTSPGPENSPILFGSWIPNTHIGRLIRNLTDFSSGIITLNSSDKIAATLTGGLENLWDAGDQYEIIDQASISFTPRLTSTADTILVEPNAAGLGLATIDPAVIGLPETQDVDITTSSPVMSLTTLNPQPFDNPPVILTTPVPLFNFGTGDAYDMTQHVSDDGLSNVTYTLSNTLPPWYSFDTNTGILTYDGTGEIIGTLIVFRTHATTSGTTCYSGVRFDADGSTLYNASGSNQSFTASTNDWLDYGDPGDLWIDVNITGGGLNWLNAASGGRVQLNTARDFGVFKDGASDGITIAAGTFEFWTAAAGGAKIAEVIFNLEAQVGIGV